MRADSSGKAAIVRACLVVTLVLGGGYLWTGAQRQFINSFCALVNPVLASMTLDDRVTATLTPAPSDMKRTAKDQVQTDSILKLEVRGSGSSSAESLPIGMRQRRDAYLPFVIFTALIGAAPLRAKWMLISWAIGAVVILLVAGVSTCLLVEFIALQIPGLYAPSFFWADTLRFLFERWLTPPGNRVVAPLLLTALLCAPHFRLPRPSSARLAEHPAQ